MVFNHGMAATLSVAGTALAGTLKSGGMDLQRELAELALMGEGSKLRLPGLRDCSFTADGAYDPTVDAALFAAYDGTVAVAVIFSPNGTVTFTANALISSYKMTVDSKGAASYSLALSGAGDVARA
jgi:hypothetical protein